MTARAGRDSVMAGKNGHARFGKRPVKTIGSWFTGILGGKARRTLVMTPADRREVSNGRKSPFRWLRWHRDRPLHRTGFAGLVATVFAATGAGSAFAQGCDASCLALAQAADQEQLLAPFNLLPNTTSGQAVLQANLLAEETIYLNTTQAEKIASGTILIAADIPANLLLRAFPGNPAYYYNAAGLPTTALPLPASIAQAVTDIENDAQLGATKPYFGSVDIYGNAYGYLPGQSDSLGNPPPYQVSSAIAANPFTAANASALAAANQQLPGAGVNWQEGNSGVGNFPSGHTLGSGIDALTYAILAPGNYQQLMLGEARFAYDLNVYGVHYPLDVIGGRIMATYVVAEMLAGNNSLYPATTFTQANIASLSAVMQSYLGGGGSSPYAAACAGNVAGCMAGGVIPGVAAYAQAQRNYVYYLTYGLPAVGDTTLAPVVPVDAHVLIATRFPYLNAAQLNQILATTELPSGGSLDNGSGWARLNLYAAASGYGRFSTDITVTMNAASGGLNAFDIWSNNISGPGGLTLEGSGTLILAGNNAYTGDTVVQGGTLGVTGRLAGNLTIWSGASFAGNGVVGGSLALLPGSTYQAAVGSNGATLTQVGGTAMLSGSTVVIAGAGTVPALGSGWPILTAAGGISGSFKALIEPASGLAAGTRFDLLYGSQAISLLVTPAAYGNLAPAGVAESGSERGVGGALDAIRPAPGTAMDPVRSALFAPLYTLPAGSITAGLDELAPSIYADVLITGRNAWYLMADAVSGQLAARRGLAADRAADSTSGPHGSRIWVSGLGGYDTIGAGGGAPGFTAGLGGMAAGIDLPVAGAGSVGVAVGTVEAQTWPQIGGNATGSTAQLATYGQWRRGMWFAEGQLGLMYQQENVHRELPLFGASTRGATDGLAGGGGVRVGAQQTLGPWLIEPSLGFGGFRLHLGGVAESGGVLAETIGGATLGSAEGTLGVTAQRGLVLSETVRMVVKGRLGWSHEFADNTARVSASFTGLNGSGFGLKSAPIGRDAALVGLAADIKAASWPVAMFLGYGGALGSSSNAQSFDAGVRFAW